MYATFTEQSIGEPIQLALDFSAPPPDHRTQVLEVSLSNRFCFLAFQNVLHALLVSGLSQDQGEASEGSAANIHKMQTKSRAANVKVLVEREKRTK